MIRFAVESDSAAIARIYSPAVTDYATSFELIAPDADEIAKRIRKISPQYPWLVFEEDGAVIGYAYASTHRERRAYQWSVDVCAYVDQSAHRRGVGRALYTSLFAILALQGYRNAYAGVTLPNPASEGLHRSVGFTLVGIYHKVGFKLGAWHDVAWFERPLAERIIDPPTPIAIEILADDPALAAAIATGQAVAKSKAWKNDSAD